MKKTININLAGMPFVIDEDACDVLKDYLDDISSRVSSQSDDLLSEVECRFAEILKDKGVDGFSVVTISHVRDVISIIGQPEIFGNVKTFVNNSQPKEYRKRLLRDPENRALGGVCSGIALYFGLDKALIRLAFALLLLLGGSSLVIYIIAWIVIPNASTPEDMAYLDELRNKIK
ncbi:MAG: PspC domain-containing protein [Rikenellaceae bacterium]